MAADLKAIYSAPTVSAAEQALVDFAERWDGQYPTISKSWMNHWQRIIPLFDFPADIRKAIYTTNAIESMNMTLRKVLRNHRSFPSDESAMKVIFLAIDNLSKKFYLYSTLSPLKTLTTYFVFDDWSHLISFMLDEFEPLKTPNSS